MESHPGKAWALGNRHEVVPGTQEAGRAWFLKLGHKLARKAARASFLRLWLSRESGNHTLLVPGEKINYGLCLDKVK